jgi:hypothetical protein
MGFGKCVQRSTTRLFEAPRATAFFLPVLCLHSISRSAIDKTDFICGNTNDKPYLSVELEYVIAPAVTELTGIYPKLAERCERGSSNIVLWMERYVVSDLAYIE